MLAVALDLDLETGKCKAFFEETLQVLLGYDWLM